MIKASYKGKYHAASSEIDTLQLSLLDIAVYALDFEILYIVYILELVLVVSAFDLDRATTKGDLQCFWIAVVRKGG